MAAVKTLKSNNFCNDDNVKQWIKEVERDTGTDSHLRRQ